MPATRATRTWCARLAPTSAPDSEATPDGVSVAQQTGTLPPYTPEMYAWLTYWPLARRFQRVVVRVGAGDRLAGDVALDRYVGQPGGQTTARVRRAGPGADVERPVTDHTARPAAGPQIGDVHPGVGGQLQPVPERAVGQVDAGRVEHGPPELVPAAVVTGLVGGLRLGPALWQVLPVLPDR